MHPDVDAPRPTMIAAVGHDARVSIIVEFFVAPDDTSAGPALETGPGRARESRSFGDFGDFGPEEALIEWECLMAGGSYEKLVEAGEPRIVAGQDEDECVVLAISPRPAAAHRSAPGAESGRSPVGGPATFHNARNEVVT